MVRHKHGNGSRFTKSAGSTGRQERRGSNIRGGQVQWPQTVKEEIQKGEEGKKKRIGQKGELPLQNSFASVRWGVTVKGDGKTEPLSDQRVGVEKTSGNHRGGRDDLSTMCPMRWHRVIALRKRGGVSKGRAEDKRRRKLGKGDC